MPWRRVKRKNVTRDFVSSARNLQLPIRFFLSLLMEKKTNLDLHLGKTVLPDDDIGGNTVLTVVEEDNPESISQYSRFK